MGHKLTNLRGSASRFTGRVDLKSESGNKALMKLPDCVGCARPAGRGRASRARTGGGLRSGSGSGGRGRAGGPHAREAARRALRIIKPRQLVPEKKAKRNQISEHKGKWKVL